jgi:hypothetical protein
MTYAYEGIFVIEDLAESVSSRCHLPRDEFDAPKPREIHSAVPITASITRLESDLYR